MDKYAVVAYCHLQADFEPMKKMYFLIALAIASLDMAHAQDVAPAPIDKPMRVLLGAGLTFGGDMLAKAHYTNGGDIMIHAGSMVALNAGIDYRVTPELSLQGTVGYHGDNASASNGHVRFDRYPIELLAYYNVAPQWRIGGGARYTTNVELSSSGAGACAGNYEFDNTLSAVAEAEYILSPHWGLKLRFVGEKFKEKLTSTKIDANHVGFFANYYF